MALKDFFKNKRNLAAALAGLAITIALVMGTFKACDLYDDAAVWKGKYEQQVELNNDQLRALKTLRESNAKYQVQLDKFNEAYAKAMEEKDAVIASKDERILVLSRQIETEMATPGRVIEVSGEKYIHMHIYELKQAQFEEAVAQKDLALEQLELQKNITLNWQKKYVLENQLRLATEVSLQDEVKLRLIGEKRIKSLEWELKKKNFSGLLKNGIILAVGAGLVYSLVK